MRDDDFATRIKQEEIKQISEKKSGFGASSFELCTILQILQKTDSLAQKVRAKAAIDSASLKGMKNLQLPKSEPSEAQNPDKNLQQTIRR